MNSQILQAVREYEDVKRTKALLPTVDQIAEKYGLSRQNLMYHAAKVLKKEGPDSQKVEAQ